MKKKAFNKLLSLIFGEIGKRLAPLNKRSEDLGMELDRIKPALEKMAKDIAELPITLKGLDGKTPTADELKELITPLIPAPLKGEDGKTPTTDELKELIVPLIPAPVKGEDGKTPTEDDLVELITPLIPAPVKGEDGKTPTEDELTKLITPLIPAPVKGDDGKTLTTDELKELIVPLIPEPIAGKDAVAPTVEQVVNALKDQAILATETFASAKIKELFERMPKPQDGKSITIDDVKEFLTLQFAQWALEFERRGHDAVQRAIDSAPKPKDGMDFESMEFDGDRRLTWKRGDVVIKEIILPSIIDRGVWQEGNYERGDAVSFGGNLWIAQCDTDVKPGPAGGENGNKHWRIAVRRGRDAKGR